MVDFGDDDEGDVQRVTFRKIRVVLILTGRWLLFCEVGVDGVEIPGIQRIIWETYVENSAINSSYLALIFF